MADVEVNPQLELRKVKLRIKQHEARMESWEVDILTKQDEIKRCQVNIDSTLDTISECEDEANEWSARCGSVLGADSK